MPIVKKEVDVVFVGFGWGSSMLAKELINTGLKMVGLERGFPRFTSPDFQSPEIHDELRFAVRKGMMQDNVRETVTLRHSLGEVALPVTRAGAEGPERFRRVERAASCPDGGELRDTAYPGCIAKAKPSDRTLCGR